MLQLNVLSVVSGTKGYPFLKLPQDFILLHEFFGSYATNQRSSILLLKKKVKGFVVFIPQNF